MIIGHYIITETTKFNKGQEFAGAVDTVEVQPGRYPIEVKRSHPYGPYICASLTGTLVYSGWFGSNTRVSEPMTPDVYHWQPYGYEVARMAGECDSRIELADGFTAQSREFDRGNGSTGTLWSIHNEDGERIQVR